MPSPKTESIRCTACPNTFAATKHDVARGRRFCSRACKVNAQTGRRRSDRGHCIVSKTCRFCKEPFASGGRDEEGVRLPGKQQVYCNKTCAGRAKAPASHRLKELSSADAQYLAQFFEGEGSAFVTVNGTSKTLLWTDEVPNTDVGVLRWLCEVTGLGSVVRRAPVKPAESPVYQWRCYGENAVGLLRQLYPYLQIKRPIADLLINAWEAIGEDPRLRYDLAWQATLLAASSRLNQRGPVGSQYRASLKAAHLDVCAALPELAGLVRRPYVAQCILGVLAALEKAEPSTPIVTDEGWLLCPVCKTEFPQPPASWARAPRRTCSRECAYAYRGRCCRPCMDLPDETRRKLAGFIDAEGCIRVKRISGTIHAEVSAGNTDRHAAETLVAATGLGVVSTRSPRNQTHSTFYNWLCRGQGAHGLLEQILPHLRIKLRQARLALYAQERLLHPGSRCGDRQWQHEVLELSRRLNARGPQPVIGPSTLGEGLIDI
jgi:hypothetical protein